MSIIGIHTPGPNILRRNYPGLLMQCRGYRPVSCDVRLACASMLPLDPQGVGLTEGDVAPEDVFNPILYKAVSNWSMSNIEKILHQMSGLNFTARGDSLDASNDGLTDDDFNIYYGLLSNTHEWKHANPQSGLEMKDLVPLVYEQLFSVGDNGIAATNGMTTGTPSNVNYGWKPDGSVSNFDSGVSFRGKPQRMPMINTTTVFSAATTTGQISPPGFPTGTGTGVPNNAEIGVPAPRIYCGIICVPPSRLHQLFYRLVCEWTLEFSTLRPLSEIANWAGLANIGNAQHVMSYDFGTSKILTEQTELVDTTAGSEIKKVM